MEHREIRTLVTGIRITPLESGGYRVETPGGTVEVDPDSMALLNLFSKPRSLEEVYQSIRGSTPWDGFCEKVEGLIRKGLLAAGPGGFRARSPSPESRCELAPGVDLLRGRDRAGLLQVRSQRLRVFSGLHAQVAVFLGCRDPQGPPTVRRIAEKAAGGSSEEAVSSVGAALADLAREGFVTFDDGVPR